MTLIDRYLGAVKDNLPRGERDDIINELSDSLRSRLEDEEAARGRPLEESEQVAFLKGYGHPMAVAARYRDDGRSVTFGIRLVGPELYPTYMKVLAVNVIIAVVIGAIALVVGGGSLFGSMASPRSLDRLSVAFDELRLVTPDRRSTRRSCDGT